jgi:short-subunit dehydrogenase
MIVINPLYFSEMPMNPTATAPKTALVTGASRGIGRELARLIAADGHSLVLVGRDHVALEQLADHLRETHGVSVRCEARDLSQPHVASRLWSDLADAGIAIDMLVNNAGVGLYGKVQDREPEALEAMLQLNVVALSMLTRLALPGMLARRWGRILNVGSVVGYQPAGPGMGGYYASKAFVVSFSRSLARELAGSGVSVTALSPGLTESSFEERSGAGQTNLYKFLPKMTAAAVARAGYDGMKRQSPVVIPGLVAKLLAFTGELPPRSIAAYVNRLLLRRSAA